MSPAKSTRVWLAAAAGVVLLVVIAMLAWLPGRSHRSATPSGGISGETVKRVLLDGTTLATMLGQPFEKSAESPRYGGLDQMDADAPPGDCTGVVNVAPQSVYRSAPVRSYARETWGDIEASSADFHPLTSTVMFVDEAVIALPNAADAQALFTKFAEQWQRCDGRAANAEPEGADEDNRLRLPGSEMHISNVRVADSMLTAFITLDKNPKAPDTRALGVRGNCLVEVLIAFTGAENATGSAHPDRSSTDVATAMMDQVSKLS